MPIRTHLLSCSSTLLLIAHADSVDDCWIYGSVIEVFASGDSWDVKAATCSDGAVGSGGKERTN